MDLRVLARTPGADWIRKERPFRNIGAVYVPSLPSLYFGNSTISTEYDVMIHFATTQPSVLLPFSYSLATALYGKATASIAATNTVFSLLPHISY